MRPRGAGRVGLVLGAGGAVGEAFHAGTLAALADAGWDARDASVVVGTSTGAVTGALLRAGMAPEDLYARVTGEPMSPEGRRILAAGGGWPTFARAGRACGLRPSSPRLWRSLVAHPWRARPGLLLAGVLPAGDVSTAPIADGFNRLFAHRWPTAPLWVCGTDLDSGERVVLREGDIGSAVAASSAVPSYFRPVELGGRRLVDGGAHSPVNADVLADALPDIDAVVVSVPMAIAAVPRRTGIDLPGRLLNHLLALTELRALAGLPVLRFEPGAAELELMRYDASDPAHLPEIAGRARVAAGRRGEHPGRMGPARASRLTTTSRSPAPR